MDGIADRAAERRQFVGQRRRVGRLDDQRAVRNVDVEARPAVGKLQAHVSPFAGGRQDICPVS